MHNLPISLHKRVVLLILIKKLRNFPLQQLMNATLLTYLQYCRSYTNMVSGVQNFEC